MAKLKLDLHDIYNRGGEIDAELNRIVQEAISNIARHARASRVQVALEQHGDGLVLAICDDGQGFDPTSQAADGPRHFGLEIMRERAEAINAQLEVLSQPGSGTTVSLEWEA